MTNRELNDLIEAGVLTDEEMAEGEIIVDYIDPRTIPVDE